jgi:hypothetical protein
MLLMLVHRRWDLPLFSSKGKEAIKDNKIIRKLRNSS